MRTKLFLLLGVLLVLAVPTDGAAQCNLNLSYCGAVGNNPHKAVTQSNANYGGVEHATTCMVCVDMDTEPDFCHGCGGIIPGDEGQFYAELTQAFNQKNMPKLIELAGKNSTRLAVNMQRGALQLRSCDGKYVNGSININPSDAIALHNAIAVGLARAQPVPGDGHTSRVVVAAEE